MASHTEPQELRPPKEIPPAEYGQLGVDEPEPKEEFQHTWRIWVIFIILMALSLNAAIDSTIITTSLPTITREIGGANQYLWIAQSYLFATTVPQPLYGQIANIFGRRNPMFVSLVLFALGSGIAGGSNNVAMLVSGRVIQGFGSAGLSLLPEIIICDLIPPRYRGPYLSATLSTAAIGATLGPIIGGALAETDWRWIFWLNIPVSGVACIAIFFVLNVGYTRNATWQAALARVDFLGNAIFIPSMVSLFFGLIMGGTEGYPWGSWRIIMPLILGVAGWAVFHVHQGSRLCREPSMPPHLFKTRTSATGFLLIFFAAIILQAISYFMPIYFQAVKDVSPLISGVYYLPFALGIIPFGGIAGGLLSKTGLYRPLHWVGFAMSAIGTGLFSTFTGGSSRGAWIGYQVIASGGTGLIFTATLPSTLAALPEADVATATSTYSFIRALGLVWGVTMSSVVFNDQVNENVHLVEDPDLRKFLADGAAYAFASGSEDGKVQISGLPEPSKGQVVELYEKSLSVVWLVFVGVSCLGFLATFIERHIELRRDHNTEYGIADRGDSPAIAKAEEGIRQTPEEEKTVSS